MVSKDAKSTFQRGFHGRRRCRIVRSLFSTVTTGKVVLTSILVSRHFFANV